MTEDKSNDLFDFAFDPSWDMNEGSSSQAVNPQEEGSPIFQDADGSTEFLPPDPDKVPVIEHAVKQDSEEYASKPAEERMRQLYSQLHAQRFILNGMIERAKEPATTAEIEEAAEPLREQKFSIYSTANICHMLEVAGGFDRVTEDGESAQDIHGEPEIVVIDGEEYYKPADYVTVYWKATDAALSVMDERDNPARIQQLFEKESEFLPVYKRVLSMAASDEGTTTALINEAVDDDPLVANPRRFFAQHFTESLERVDAIAWDGSAWRITARGQEALDGLADVVDDYTPDADKVHRGATSDGINW